MAPDQGRSALRGALEALTASQPQSPPGRYRAIVDRVRRRRRQQAAMSATAMVVVATATTIGLGGLIHPGPPPARHVPAWALSWPDHRDGSVPRSVQAQAVLAWRHHATGTHAALPAPRRVIWYLAERLHGSVAVIFEARTQGRNWLVAGSAPAAMARAGGPQWAWDLNAVPAPRPAAALAVGMYLPSGPRAGSPDDAFLVLAGPATQSVSWTTHTAAGRRARTVAASGGLAVAVTGQLRAAVHLTTLHTRGGPVAPRPAVVGLPGSTRSQVPMLMPAQGLSMPAGWDMNWEMSGQGRSGGAVGPATHPPGTRPGLVVRCSGPGHVTVTRAALSAHSHPVGSFPCDGRQHVDRLPAWLPGLHAIGVSASRLTVYQVTLATR
ncbi:MAG TPA: hypothetical protein VH641_15515 [Streptosporangiaceae bacterium]|jgi:hypothetical protein